MRWAGDLLDANGAYIGKLWAADDAERDTLSRINVDAGRTIFWGTFPGEGIACLPEDEES